MTTAAKRKSGFVNPMGLLQRVQAHGGGVQPDSLPGAQKLDPADIRPSRWANRHADSLAGLEFEALKAEIQSAGGNVQPIKVRPAPGGYEVVFGHRRHRACAELGLQVLAVVESLTDAELFTQMERENRGRKDLSAWEQGMMYRRALDAGLFPSLRRMAETLGIGAGTISKAMTIAQLPDEVVNAFPSPNGISFMWASDLRAALERNEKAVLAAAKTIPPGTAPREVLALLLSSVSSGNAVQKTSVSSGNTQGEKRLNVGRGTAAVMRTDGERTVLELNARALPQERWEEFEAVLRQFFNQ